MTWLAIDIGGANLKASNGADYSAARSFPLWKQADRLAVELRQMIGTAPLANRFAVTMTGELADCFATRTQGVQFILAAVKEATDGREVVVYQTDGALAGIDERPPSAALLAAASNWHALASFAARYTEELPSVLIDAGSTTVDIIPIVRGRPAARGVTDVDRLIHGELVYTGVERSPVCAIVDALPYRGMSVPVAQELFATAVDAYLLLGDWPEDPRNLDTVDGRPQTRDAARQRLGRAICTEFLEEEAIRAAVAVREAQLTMLRRALALVTSTMAAPPRRLILSGHGEFLLRRLVDQLATEIDVISLNDELGPIGNRCAPAYALAVLARERLGR